MRMPSRSALVVACWLLPACGTAPAPLAPHLARPVVELARWQVVSGGDVVGYVVHLEIQDPQGPLPYYRIQDLHGRWIGHASANGRFSRRVPFQDSEEDLGVWPMASGVGKLFEAAAPVTLTPVAVEADARRER